MSSTPSLVTQLEGPASGGIPSSDNLRAGSASSTKSFSGPSFKALFNTRSDKFFWALFSLCFIYFLLQISFVALKLAPFISPDEHQHYLTSVEVNKQSGFFVETTAPVRYFGAVHRWPFAFYRVTGWWLNLKPEARNDLKFLRVFSVGLAAFNFILLGLLSWICMKTTIGRIWPALVAVNLVMFIFISGSHSYDNAVNMLSTAMVLAMVMFFKTGYLEWLLASLIAVGLACYIKIAGIPWALFTPLVAGLITCWYLWRKHFRIRIFSKWITAGTALILLVLFGLNTALYGVNYFRYGSLLASCDKVFDLEYCMNTVAEFRVNREIARPEAEPRISFSDFASRYYPLARDRVFGVFAHRSYEPKAWVGQAADWFLSLSTLAILSALLMLVFSKHSRDSTRNLNMFLVLAGCALTYMATVFLQNYYGYLNSGVFGAALQGRYHFPALFPLLVLIAFSFEIIALRFGTLIGSWARNWFLALTLLVALITAPLGVYAVLQSDLVLSEWFEIGPR